MSLLTAPIRLAAHAVRALLDRLTARPGAAAADHEPRAAAEPAAAAAEPAAATPAARAPRAGKHDAALIAVVSARPGITVAEAASELDLPATALYPVIRRLETQGTLVKLGRELHPPR